MTADPQPHLAAAQRSMPRDATRIAKREERRQQHERDQYLATHDEREDEGPMSVDRYAQQIAAVSKSKVTAAKQVSKGHAKKARQREKRRMKDATSAAVTADIWQDREGKARLTEERQRQGSWVQRDGEDAGVTVAVDERAHVLDQLAAKGIIDSDQCRADHDFAALMERTRLVAGGRSCLNMDPVGHEGDAKPTHSELWDADERRDLNQRMGSWLWSEMRMVCHQGFWPKRLDRLREGLDVATRSWMGGKK